MVNEVISTTTNPISSARPTQSNDSPCARPANNPVPGRISAPDAPQHML